MNCCKELWKISSISVQILWLTKNDKLKKSNAFHFIRNMKNSISEICSEIINQETR